MSTLGKALIISMIAFVLTCLLFSEQVAEAVCPACIAGAGLGVANAFSRGDLYRLGFWLSGFLYLFFRYVQMKIVKIRLATVKIIFLSASASFPLFYFTVGAAALIGAQRIPALDGTGTLRLFASGSLIGSLTAFTATVGTCALKENYGIKIPFFQITVILTILWLVSLA